jgi:RNA polymerase sigma-B factor
MMGEVRRHYRDTGWAVHVTRGAQELAQRVLAAERAEAGRLSAEEVAQRLDLTVEQVVDGRLAAQAMRADSLDRPRDDEREGDRTAHVAAVEDMGFRAAENRATLERLTAGLPERERRILALRYSADLSQAEIGRRVGLSQMHVSRILRRTLAELGGAT